MLISVVMVPFLLSRDVLGAEGYGRIAVYLTILSFMAILVDGVRLEAGRKIGSSYRENPNDDGSWRKLASSCQAAALLVAAAALCILPIIYLSLNISASRESVLPAITVIAIFVVETAVYAHQSYLHTRGQTHLVNTVLSADVIVRNAVMFVIFSFFASVELYFALYLIGAVAKASIFVRCSNHYSKSHESASFGGMNISRTFRLLSDSRHASEGAVSGYLIYRAPILITARLIGEEAAGFLSIVVLTLRNYLVQFLYGVFRPMLVPLGATRNAREASKEKLDIMDAALTLYFALATFFILSLVVWSRPLLEAWLEDIGTLVLTPTVYFLCGAGVAIGNSPKVAILISQGEAPRLARITIPSAAFTFVAIGIYMHMASTWELTPIFISGYAFLVAGMWTDFLYSWTVLQNQKKQAMSHTLQNAATYIALTIGALVVMSLRGLDDSIASYVAGWSTFAAYLILVSYIGFPSIRNISGLRRLFNRGSLR